MKQGFSVLTPAAHSYARSILPTPLPSRSQAILMACLGFALTASASAVFAQGPFCYLP